MTGQRIRPPRETRAESTVKNAVDPPSAALTRSPPSAPTEQLLMDLPPPCVPGLVDVEIPQPRAPAPPQLLDIPVKATRATGPLGREAGQPSGPPAASSTADYRDVNRAPDEGVFRELAGLAVGLRLAGWILKLLAIACLAGLNDWVQNVRRRRR